jgi:FAD synthase
MGPREALEHIRALIREALATDDIDRAHRLLREMFAITGKAVGRGTLRRERLLRTRISA